LSPSGTDSFSAQSQALAGGDEPGGLQGSPDRLGLRTEDVRTVGLLHGEPTERPPAYGGAERVDRGCGDHVVVAERQERPAATLDVQRERALDEHDQGTRLATRAVPRLLLRPGQCRAVRVRGVGRRQRHCLRLVRRCRADEGTQPVDSAGGAELGRTQAVDEVPATAATGLLEPRQHAVRRGEAAGRPLARDGAARDDTVPVEQALGRGVGTPGRVGLDLGEHEPAAGHVGGAPAGRHR
jgi:hypothetical protein